MSLATRYLRTPFVNVPGPAEKIRKAAHNLLHSHLHLPTSVEDGVKWAERFAFDHDAPLLVSQHVHDGGIDLKIMFETCKMAAPSVWVEYKAEADRMNVGILCAADSVVNDKKAVMVVVVEDYHKSTPPLLYALWGMPPAPWKYQETEIFVGMLDNRIKGAGWDRGDRDLISQLVHDFVMCMFLIQTPRASELRQADGVRKPHKRHDLPQVELKRVIVKIGKPAPRYEKHSSGQPADDMGDRIRRRAHLVNNHFRTYTGKNPHITLIEQHWRGDPALGIVMKERVYKKA